MKKFCALLAAGALLGLFSAQAAGFDFYASGPYREDVPRPEAFLGYELGTLHTHHFRMEDYFEALAAAAPERIELRSYGESYERKRLFIAVITSEENLARIEEIRRRNLTLADPGPTSRTEAEAIAAEAPVLVWLDYGNDGNETANVEAAMQVAYQLVAGESEAARRMRREAVVIVEPDHNPESHDRHVAWYNAFGVGDPEPLAMEHHAPWGMSTNNNHYQIDLNRDAWPLTQRENQAIAVEYLRWRPQVFVDHHGQTENYFFPPPMAPVNPSLPDSHQRWFEEFGRGNAGAFDRYGWQYWVRDVFDLHYPGYWDSWPALHGAIGMTYETDGGGSRGLAWRRRDGSIVTFRDGIARHFVASLATVQTAVKNRQGLLRDFYDFFAAARKKGAAGSPARAFVFEAEQDPRRSAALAATLLRHGVRVSRTTTPLAARGVSLETGQAERVELEPGSYLVDMAQPDQRAAETFLAREALMDPAFVREQYARWSLNARRAEKAERELYEFYDLTSWSLPLAYGVAAWELAELPAVESEPLQPREERLAGSGDWASEIPFEMPGFEAGVVGRIASVDGAIEPAADGARAGSAYLFRPEAEGSMRLVAALLKEGYRVAVALAPLEVGAQKFPRGSFAVQVDRNPDTLHERLPELAREAGVAVWAADTAFASRGKIGLGSHRVVGLRRPRIAMLADEGVRITEYGAAWFTLEKRLGYPFTPIRFDELLRADLDKLDVIVLPNGSSRAYGKALGEEGAQKLAGWIERGGTLVTWGSGGAEWAIQAELVSSSFVGIREESENEGADAGPGESGERLAEIDELAPEAPRPPVPSPSADPDRPQPIPGSVARTRLDPTHWLTLGYSRQELPVLVRGHRFLGLSESGENPVVFSEADRLRVAGFFWPGNSELWLAGSAYALVEPKGKGQVVLFAQDPNYRLVWRATSRLFANALLLGPTLGTDVSQGL